ncbi:MAG: hypothetical protein JRJ24_16960, partial [Deltaproteobacteria bacterium]|nr:hypothetical protein [Deltaproteobacteria bacterium]
MSKQPRLVTELLTPEEDTEARRQQLEQHDFALLRAAKAAGARIAAPADRFTILNPEALGLDAPPPDDEHRELKLPRIRRRDVYLPLDDRTLTAREFTGPFRKTPKKEREFLAKCTRGAELPRHTVIETGTDFERRAIATTEELALKKAGVTPGEPVRAVLVDCKDESLAAEIVESKRDSLPWCEDLKLGPGGGLPIGWHGLPLNSVEQRLLQDQSTKDRAEKRKRIEKLTRQML